MAALHRVRGVRPYAPSYMGTNIRGGDRDKGCDFLLRNLIGGGVEEGKIDDVLRRRILSGAVQTASFVMPVYLLPCTTLVMYWQFIHI